jgi:hypothetical protein
MQRWFLVFSALMKGYAYIQPLDNKMVFPDKREITSHIKIRREIISAPQDIEVGYLSKMTLCVPSMSRLWEDEARVHQLAQMLDAVSPAEDWIRAVRQVGECKYGRQKTPAWVSFLSEVLPNSREGMYTPIKCDVAQVVHVDWGGDVCRLPLPASQKEGQGSRISLIDYLCRESFSLPRKPMSSSSTEELLEEERLVLSTVEQNQARIKRFVNPWSKPPEQHVLWIERFTDRELRLMNEGLFFVPNRGFAMEIQNDAEPLHPNDVFTKHILVLQPPEETAREGTPIISIPVKSEFAALVSDYSLERMQGNRVDVSITLVGGRIAEKTYRTPDLIEVKTHKQLDLLSWPYRTTLPSGAHSILFGQEYGKKMSFRVLYGDDTVSKFEGLSLASDWQYGSQHFYHLEPFRHQLPSSHRPLGIVIRSNGAQGIAQLRGSSMEMSDDKKYELGIVPYYVQVQPPDLQHERWCIDFGSSSSVVARYFQGLSDSHIISPRLEGDATTVYSLGSQIFHFELAWFATWERYGPSGTRSKILPSQVIELCEKPGEPRKGPAGNVDWLKYGQDFILDNGQEIDEAYIDGTAGTVVSDLKWRYDAKGQYRVRFLQHLLEQAISLETMRSAMPDDNLPSLPSQIDLTFTLPLRQRQELVRFSEDAEEVCKRLKASTGITFLPRYQWESLAVVPPMLAVSGKAMFVVADLGGGTLDMYAAHYLHGQRQRHALESTRIGGRYCLDIMRKRGAIQTNREFRKRLDKKEQLEILSTAPAIQGYFTVIHHFIILWVNSLRVRWGLENHDTIFLMLAGLGWSLPGSKLTQERVAKHLKKEARRMNLHISFEAWDEDPAVGRQGAPDNENRKTYLARTCARGINPSEIDELRTVANQSDMVLGMNVQASGRQFSHDTALQDMDESNLTYLVDESEFTKFLGPALSEQILTRQMMTRVTQRLSEQLRPGEDFSGAFDPLSGHLVSTALSIVAEEAIQGLLSLKKTFRVK